MSTKPDSLISKIQGLIRKYLDSIDIGDFTELRDNERDTYLEWQEVIEAEVTIEGLQEFIAAQLDEQQKALRDAVTEGNDRASMKAAARIDNYEALLGFIEAPERNREQLAQHLESITG